MDEYTPPRGHLYVKGRRQIFQDVGCVMDTDSVRYRWEDQDLLMPCFEQPNPTECYVRGNTVKYIRVPDVVLEKVREDDLKKDRQRDNAFRGRGRGRGRGRAGNMRGRGRGRGGERKQG